MKKILRFIKFVGFTFLSLTVLYLALAAILSLLPTNPVIHNCKKVQTIYLANNGVHLDIVIPAKYLSDTLLQRIHSRFDTRFLSFGWGDKEFYMNTPTWNDLTIKTTFNALFLRKPSAVHIGYFRNSYSDWLIIELCPEQLGKIMTFIDNGFKKTSQGNFKLIEGAGYTLNDDFFNAHGNFMFYRTCNTWVNQGLKEGDIRTSVWSAFTWGILFHQEK